MTHRISRFIAMLLALTCCPVAVAQPTDSPKTYIGRKFWYEPEHAKFARVEFHRVPRYDRGTVNVRKKTRFEITAVAGAFLKVRFEYRIDGESTAFLPVRTLRSRLYTPRLTESFRETFDQAAFFEEDPEVIKKRLDQADKPAAKSPAIAPPWKIRKHGPAWPALPAAPEADPPAPR